MENKIEITKNAQKHIVSIIGNENSTYFRISVSGGGCAGFQYVWGLTSDESLSHVKW